MGEWGAENVKVTLKSIHLKNNYINKKEFYFFLRNLLTGRDKGPELPQIIYLLNKEEVIKRLEEL